MNTLEESGAPLGEPKRRGRKPKKQSQKELLNMYYEEVGESPKEETSLRKTVVEQFTLFVTQGKT
jgi:hypothetical protein